MKYLKPGRNKKWFWIPYFPNNFCLLKNLNWTLDFFFFSLFLSATSSTLSTWLFRPRPFTGSYIFASKLIFVNLFNSGVLTKPVVSGISSLTFVAFVLRAAFVVVRLVISSILFLICGFFIRHGSVSNSDYYVSCFRSM